MPASGIILYIVAYFGLFTAVFFLLTLIENRNQIKNPEPQKKLPTVTVMVPACNEESCLAKTVKSLLALDYPKELLQIIIIDDGSTDKTLKIARGFEKDGVLVLTKENGGKGTALNLGLEHATGEFAGCLDADSIVMPDALVKMIGYFKKKTVMAVTPSLKCTKPNTVWQKVQVIEFLLGVYLRKVFSFLGSINVTPGPFTIFRKAFFDKHGGYDTTTCTEDIEISLRIQSLGYEIENAVDANVYAVAMPTFDTTKKQRVRWYKGFIENTQKYKHIMFSKKYGNLGLFIMPSAYLSVVLAMVMVLYSGYLLVDVNYQRAVNLYNVNFDIWKMLKIRWDPFYIDQSPIFMIGIVALTIGLATIYLAKTMSKEKQGLTTCYILFLVLYLPLYAYWWANAIWAKAAKKNVDWKGRKRKQIEIRYS
ncbi:glycosyltransferase family 2 protein [Candidatus Woesearchaeota archaeon]|nr:glycosyltransferase family 2 protein [Candidatus Woesearchaeota archaeon]